MENNRPLYIIAGYILLVLVLTPGQPVMATYMYDVPSDEEPQLICSKNEMTELKYAPTGDLVTQVSRIQFKVYNNGSRPATIGITDRIESLDVSTLRTLYGTPWPTRVDTFGNLTKLFWDNVIVDADSALEYQYLAESRKTIPLVVEEVLLINGNPANITRINDLYLVNANSSDILTFEMTLENVCQKLYAGGRTVTPSLECVVMVPLSEDYFSVVETSPTPNSTSVTAGKSVVTWFILLDDTPRTLTVSAKLVETSPWGEAPVDPIAIQVSSGKTAIGLEKSVEYLDASMAMIENVKNVFRELSNATDQMYEAAEDIADAVSEESEDSQKLVMDTLKVISSGLTIHIDLLEDTERYLGTAIDSLDAFMTDPRTIQFLLENVDLAIPLERARINMGIAYTAIGRLQRGDPSTGTPGLGALSYMVTQLSLGFSSMVTGMEELVDGIHELAEGIHLIPDAARVAEDEIDASLEDLSREKEDLEELTLILQRLKIPPYDVEIGSGELVGSYEIKIEMLSEGEKRWKISNVTMRNLGGHSKIVYGLAIRMMQSSAQTPLVDIHVNDTWQTFENDLAQLGLVYDGTESTMYLWPRIEVGVASTQELLVDWGGHPITIILESESKPEVDCWVDVADLPDSVLKTTKSQDTYLVVQPHFLDKNLTTIDYPPPPVPQDDRSIDRWKTIIMETLQRYGVHLLVTTSIVIVIGYGIGSLISRRSSTRKASDGRRTVLAESIEVAKLLEEIETIEKALEGEDQDRQERTSEN